MLKRACMACLSLSLLVALTAVTYAQSDARLVFDLPFDFHVGDKVLPAGEYSVAQVTASGMAIRAQDGSEAAIFLSNALHPKARGDGKGQLVFNRYGDQYFLSRVWRPAGDGRELMQSRRERNLRRELRIAKGSTPTQAEPEIVLVAARTAAR